MSARRCIAIVALVIAAIPAAASAQAKRPNILFAFADDWGRHASAYAQIDGPGSVNDLIRTPTFDSIAAEGVLFRSAFVGAPSCTPCRSSLLSGQHFWRTGRAAILNGAVWDFSSPAYPLMLREAGYHIGKSYKVWSPGTPPDAPYGGREHAYEGRGRRFNQFSQNVTRMVADGLPLEQAKQTLYDEVVGNFDDFLADRQPDQPFCFWFGPTNVHRTWIQGSGKALWGLEPDQLRGKMPAFLPDAPVVREDLADYFGEAMAFDTVLGLLIERLKATGEWENTVVVVSGDHGAPGFPHGKCNLYDFGVGVPLAIRWGGRDLGTPGRVIDDLVSLTDLAPTFLELAGVETPASMTGRSLVPLLASDQAGRIDPLRDAVYFGRERHVANARDGFAPYPQRAIRTHDQLYIVNFRPDRWPLGEPYRLNGGNPPTTQEMITRTRVTLPDEDAGPTKAWLVDHRNDPMWQPTFELAYGKRPAEELYDLKVDPQQINNLAAELGYQAVRETLRNRLLNELRQTGDPRLVDDGAFFENPPLSGRPAGSRGEEAVTPEQLRSGRLSDSD